MIDWTPIDPLLGTMTDRAVADNFGISSCSVCYRRKELQIPPFGRSTKPIDSPLTPLLGVVPDIDLAKAMGVCRERVRQLRERKKIPKFNMMHFRKKWVDDVIQEFQKGLPDNA
jgi:hypothetical protein